MGWDGERFAFVTDFLGAGAMGESGADGVRPPRPEESVKIEPGRLAPKDGHYLVKIAEPMDEVLYLDKLRMLVIDHPPNLSVYPDERFVTDGAQPTQDLLVFGERVFPKSARDHLGRDLTGTVRHRDSRAVDGFAKRSWLGFAEEHYLELDFGDRPAPADGDPRTFLVLAGWTDYPYPESIFAAAQAGVPLKAPVLERLGDDGQWRSLGELGFPAGLTRVITREVTGQVGGPKCVLRIRTNMQVYWDQVSLAPLVESPAPGRNGRVRVASLDVAGAELTARGFMREVNGPPLAYDDARTEPVAVTAWHGRLTRTGDVTELLRDADDRFVLCGPGDEITARFDAKGLSPLPEGWVRSFVLRSWGYCKDVSPFTLTGGDVEPLPFRGMATYPFGPADDRAAGPVRDEYRRRWNTRIPGSRP
jgi:hypothetical protein